MVFGSFTSGLMGGASVNIVIRAVDQFSSSFSNANRQMGVMGKSASILKGSFLALGVAAAAIGVISIKTAIDFESAFAGVKKTVDLTEEGFKDLENRFLTLSKTIPVSFVELAKIGELAGQLGVEGVDNIESFTRTIADISNTTNMTSEAAATDFARIANIMQLPIKRTNNMASAIVDLGNNFATTESEIAGFAQRIAGTAKIAGFTTADILAIGTAFSSVGVQAEAGGTATQKVMIKMTQSVATGNKQLAVFAKTAGLSANEFAKVFKEDASKAFEKFVVGLGEQGEEAFTTLEKLELQDQRLVKSFLSLANAGNLITDTFKTSDAAWKSNTALAEEAEKRYETTESKLKVLKGQMLDAANTIGQNLLPELDKLIDVFAKNSEGITNLATDVGKAFIQIISSITDGVVALDTFLWKAASLGSIGSKNWSLKQHKALSDGMRMYDVVVRDAGKSVEEFVKLYPKHAEAIKIANADVKRAIEERNLAQLAALETINQYDSIADEIIAKEEERISLINQGNDIADDAITTEKERAEAAIISSMALDIETVAIEEGIIATEAATAALEKEIDARKRRAKLLGGVALSHGGGTYEEIKRYLEKKEAGEETATFDPAFGEGSVSVDDFILSHGKLIKTNPQDTIVGTKNDINMGASTIESSDDSILSHEQSIKTNPQDTMVGAKNGVGMGTSIIIKDNNIFGTDPDQIAEALQDRLTAMVSQ